MRYARVSLRRCLSAVAIVKASSAKSVSIHGYVSQVPARSVKISSKAKGYQRNYSMSLDSAPSNVKTKVKAAMQ